MNKIIEKSTRSQIKPIKKESISFLFKIIE